MARFQTGLGVVGVVGLFVSCAAIGSAGAKAREPRSPLIHTIDAYLRRNETGGVTLDPRFELNPTEVTRLSVVCQLLGYCDLDEARTRNPYRREILARAEYLVAHLPEITTGSSFDGMVGYALLGAFERTGHRESFRIGQAIAHRLQSAQGYDMMLNWGLMAAMCLAREHRLTGDPRSLAKVREILADLGRLQHPDGSFPHSHYCPRSRDVHYTSWMGVELSMIARDVRDENLDRILARIALFLEARVGADGLTIYEECAPCSSDGDRDGICDADDECRATPSGCSVDPGGCEILDDDRNCLPGGPAPSCRFFDSRRSGCGLDYDTRGWVNELGYQALIFDRFQSHDLRHVVGRIAKLTRHGVLPDKWGWWPSTSEPGFVWASSDSSVMRTSVVFWCLAAIERGHDPSSPPAFVPPLGGSSPAASSFAAPAAARSKGWLAADSLVLAGIAREARAPRGAAFGRAEPESDSKRATGLDTSAWMRAQGSRVAYDLPVDGLVSLELYDVAGRRVRSHRSVERAGKQAWTWDGLEDSGRVAPVGIYLARLRIGSREGICRIALVR